MTSIVADRIECPKCGTERYVDAACAKCGLEPGRAAAFIAVSPELAAAWTELEAAWDDDKRHDAILARAATEGAYPWLAGKYRRRGDDVAKKQIARIQRAVEVTLQATATPIKPKSKARFAVTIMVLALLAGLVAVGLLFVHANMKTR